MLTAHVVLRPSGGDPATVDTRMLRAHLAASLPDYLVPSSIMAVDEIPVTSSGKVDRNALPEPPGPAAAGRTPRTEPERVLCELFAELLELPSVGIDDGFFDLGGHSLLATRLISRARSALGVELSIKTVFEAQTVAALAEQLGTAEKARPALRPRMREAS
jgi:acyl carrier protein